MKLQDFDFRIWDNTKKCFLKANPFIFISKDKNSTVEVGTEVYYKDLGCEDDGTTKIFKPKEFDIEIELWTGFYDKNGNKIYENDILESKDLEEIYHITRDDINKMFKIEMYEEDFEKKLRKRKAEPDISFLRSFKSEKNMEVIGNIRENKDLLK
ncbi:YopX family protein [Campylobacter jejuni]|uniref:YopX family protein n=1 Tax=Campylobacter jejuni TaxID=197 RepID=UPI00073DD2D0|nr:YopX family protein [Campylobacter jejuni]ALW15585.1 hypothetical protein RC26_02510 [Campylobacter jejuni]